MGKIVPLLTKAKCLQLITRCNTLNELYVLDDVLIPDEIATDKDVILAVLMKESELMNINLSVL